VSENVEMIQPLMSNISNIFGFGPLVANERIRLDRTLFCEVTGPRGMYKISVSELPPENEPSTTKCLLVPMPLLAMPK
jgi:hypothetical protein